ncbi:hypothetical protein PUN28_000126 [Cardiocondyla obscurior]|uniref:Uncharacterized protein n=1 Tax=Cardiocondyla obscurior TaxID=286306 RepID=A0AAW2GXV8_9HYME
MYKVFSRIDYRVEITFKPCFKANFICIFPSNRNFKSDVNNIQLILKLHLLKYRASRLVSLAERRVPIRA